MLRNLSVRFSRAALPRRAVCTATAGMMRRTHHASSFPSSSFASNSASTALVTTQLNFIRRCSSNSTPASTSTSTSTSTPTSASNQKPEEKDNSSKADEKAPLTAAERAALCAPPGVVTSQNFEQVVLQSNLAICLTYHVDNTRCRAFLKRIEDAINDINIRCRTRWLSLMLVDADRNPSLAGAFSIERVKLPITFFVFSGTIVDKVNGVIAAERLESILKRFMEYYQEQKGVDLEDHGFAVQAKVEAISQGVVSTQELEVKLEWMLLGKERLVFPALKNNNNANNNNETTDDDKVAAEARALSDKAVQQAEKDLVELQNEIGLNVRKIDAAQLVSVYYSKPAYIAAARAAFFRALVDVVDAKKVATKDASKRLKSALDEFKYGMPRPTVRYTACVAQLRLAQRWAREMLAAKNQHDQNQQQAAAAADQAQQKEEVSDAVTAALNNIASSWVDAVDKPGGLDGVFPQPAVDEMLTTYRQMSVTVRKAAKISAPVTAEAKQTQVLVGDCIRATLQLFPDDTKCNIARTRFSAMMH